MMSNASSTALGSPNAPSAETTSVPGPPGPPGLTRSAPIRLDGSLAGRITSLRRTVGPAGSASSRGTSMVAAFRPPASPQAMVPAAGEAGGGAAEGGAERSRRRSAVGEGVATGAGEGVATGAGEGVATGAGEWRRDGGRGDERARGRGRPRCAGRHHNGQGDQQGRRPGRPANARPELRHALTPSVRTGASLARGCRGDNGSPNRHWGGRSADASRRRRRSHGVD